MYTNADMFLCTTAYKPAIVESTSPPLAVWYKRRYLHFWPLAWQPHTQCTHEVDMRKGAKVEAAALSQEESRRDHSSACVPLEREREVTS